MSYTFQDLKDKLLQIKNDMDAYGVTFQKWDNYGNTLRSGFCTSTFRAEFTDLFGIFLIPSNSLYGICIEDKRVWITDTIKPCTMEEMIVNDDNCFSREFNIESQIDSIPDFRKADWMIEEIMKMER